MGARPSRQRATEALPWDFTWTISALMALSNISKKLQREFGHSDKRSDCLRNIETSTWFLHRHLQGIGITEAENMMKDIRKIAGHLNVIFNVARPADNGSHVDLYERQKEIQDIVNAKNPSDDGLVDILKFGRPESIRSWLGLQLDMERLTDKCEYQNGILDDEIEASKIPKYLHPPDDKACQFVSNAFDAAIHDCGLHCQQDVRLRLGTHKQGDGKPKPTSLCVMASNACESKHSLQWHELEVSAGKMDETATQPQDCICRYLSKHNDSHYQLNLILVKNGLTRSPHLADQAILNPKSLRGQIDLKSLIAVRDKTWGLDIKWVLALLLSYSLLYLHGGSRIESLWQRENIKFFLDGSGILPLRPFLGNFESTVDTDSNTLLHDDPGILMLGTMLLEIFLGESLESFLEKKDITPGESLYFRGLRAFEQPEFFCFPPQFRLAIRACLSPATFSKVRKNQELMRLEFFNRIIAPLEAAAWEHFTTLDPGDLDEAAAVAFNLARGVDQAHFQLFTSDSHLQGHSPACLRRHTHIAPREERLLNVATSTANENDEIGMLSDMKGSPNDWQDWQNWFQEFKTFRKLTFPRTPDCDGNRPKVTVIDTGIDASHRFIQSTRWPLHDSDEDSPLFHDFSGQDKFEPVDDDGHGTFVAGLLLELAPYIRLSVARIGISKKTISADMCIADKVIKAIDHAMKKWKTEIISISFGLIHRSPKLQTAIEDAIQSGIIIFAAAGNHGNNKPMHFPASHRKVFKVLAGDRDGVVTMFSALPNDMNASEYSFATIGHQIVSTWPTHLRHEAEHLGCRILCWNTKKSRPNDSCTHPANQCDLRVVMSGTSFATPIVAAHAALLYQFYEENQASDCAVKLTKGREHKFKTPEAVLAMLTAMSRIAGTSSTRTCNFLAPRWGRDKEMNLEAAGRPGENQEEFFSRKLTEILLKEEV